MFQCYNANPLSKRINDDVVRAIAIAESKSWYEVFGILSAIAIQKASLPIMPDVFEEYLDNKYVTIDNKYIDEDLALKKSYKVKQICQWEGIYIVKLSHSVTTVVQGINIDITNQMSKTSFKIWKVL